MKKGSRHSREAIEKMSKTKIGINNPMYGKHWSEEAKREMIKKIKTKFIGGGNPFYGKFHSKVSKERISDALKGKSLPEEHKQNISKGLCGINNPWFGKHLPEEMKQRISKAHEGMIASLEAKEKMSASTKESWKNLEYAQNQMIGRRITPNKAELKSLEIFQPFGFEFTGDGKHPVGGKWPDFWDGETKLIELYGDYWHRDDDPQERIDFFKSYGYDCLIIWEHELKNTDLVLERVSMFIRSQ